MKVLYVKGKGYYIEGTDILWSSWTQNIQEATKYSEQEATHVAMVRSEITSYDFEIKEVSDNEEELEALRHRNINQAKDIDRQNC